MAFWLEKFRREDEEEKEKLLNKLMKKMQR